MSINKWGPAVWLLFHTIVEKIKEPDNTSLCRELFYQIKNICKFLPCPDCASHASINLANVNISRINSKTDLKQILFIFHNSVNIRKKKALFSLDELNKYTRANLSAVIYNFKMNYNSTRNLRLMSDTFQRNLVMTEFVKWLKINKTYLNP
jgi:formylmethanofuran dehydrogenase subunit E-like metal-binding protein